MDVRHIGHDECQFHKRRDDASKVTGQTEVRLSVLVTSKLRRDSGSLASLMREFFPKQIQENEKGKMGVE
jgi:hypothetical protein